MTGRQRLVDDATAAIRRHPLCQLGVTAAQAHFAAQAVVDALHPADVNYTPDSLWLVCARTPDGDEHAKAVCTCTPDPCAAPDGPYVKVNSWVHGPACQVTVAQIAAEKAANDD